MLGNILLHEACHRQKISMKSSMEAKLVALSDYTPYGEMAEELLIWTSDS
jgi:hypothetical protein